MTVFHKSFSSKFIQGDDFMHPGKFREQTEDDIRVKKMNQIFYFAIGAAILLIVYFLLT